MLGIRTPSAFYIVRNTDPSIFLAVYSHMCFDMRGRLPWYTREIGRR